MSLTIAIDGPSGAGKSVLAERLAQRLAYRYVDTGALYRAITLAAIRDNVPLDSPDKLTALAQSVDIRIEPDGIEDGRQYTVLLGGVDVTWEIRSAEVERLVSTVSAVPGVRRALIDQQRRIAAHGRTVMVGRDIATVVLPEADLKIFLTASPEVRARRRMAQLTARGVEPNYHDVLTDILRRDEIDSGRSTAPLRQAPGATLLVNDDLTIDQLVDQALALVEEVRRRGCNARSNP